MSDPLLALPAEALYTSCDADRLGFKTTAELDALTDVVGQPRAVEAVKFAIGMRHDGYNLFVLGPEGTGKSSLVHRYLTQEAMTEPVPTDWCYIHNFDEPHRPKALAVPPGRGSRLRADMERLIEELRAAIPAAFESDEYHNRKNAIEEKYKERQEEGFSEFQKRARARDIALIRTPVGLALAPMEKDEVLSPQKFEELSEKEKTKRKNAMEDLQKELETLLHAIPGIQKEQREDIKALDQEITMYAVGHLIEGLNKDWRDQPEVLAYLESVRKDVIENAAAFLPHEPTGLAAMIGGGQHPPEGLESQAFRKYRINVLVDNARTKDGAILEGAPVIDEDHPTQPNLIGRTEHVSQFGTLFTDFTLIKPGALHRANGGYLILDARKLLMQPFAWETLMRTLRSGHVRIESPGESLGWITTQTLQPEPIPLKTKVVLLGEPWLYYLLTRYDPDFRELFKVAADFEGRMDRNDEAAHQYARLIATLNKKDSIKPFDAGAVARMVEYGARLADDAEKLSTHMGKVVDLACESDFWAGRDLSDTVSAKHVQKAIDAKIHRSDRIRERIQEEIQRGTLVIETDGEKTGQVNGLSVIQLDGYAFGRPSRISCSVRLGKGEVVDIEREVELGGPLHSKGVMILSSFLGNRFGRKTPLSLRASLVFEQSYGGVEGDSASSAELYALLSAIAGAPIRQSLAVTGSVDQLGRIQAIGGVNEKIEGFFDICAERGLTGAQGVLIPATNVKHLMLRADVVDAASQGRFHIYPVETVDQGIALLTGMEAGEADKDGQYPIGSVNRAVARGLEALAREARVQLKEAASANNLSKREAMP
ncbi:MAG: AAA family ATPase [Rhodospirillales bacterium]|nr:AAA family ATPase [Rhodospirillales bacterium]